MQTRTTFDELVTHLMPPLETDLLTAHECLDRIGVPERECLIARIQWLGAHAPFVAIAVSAITGADETPPTCIAAAA